MNNTKHTPGPWALSTHHISESIKVIHDGNGIEIGRVYLDDIDRQFKGPSKTSKEAEANAKLIAKAWLIPELVEALQFCQSVIQSQGLFDRSEQLANEKALAAIKKATS